MKKKEWVKQFTKTFLKQPFTMQCLKFWSHLCWCHSSGRHLPDAKQIPSTATDNFFLRTSSQLLIPHPVNLCQNRWGTGSMHRGSWIRCLQFPACFHLCVTLMHIGNGLKEKFIQDLKEATTEIMKDPKNADGESDAIYGMASTISDRSIVGDLVITYMNTTLFSKGKQRHARKRRRKMVLLLQFLLLSNKNIPKIQSKTKTSTSRCRSFSTWVARSDCPPKLLLF